MEPISVRVPQPASVPPKAPRLPMVTIQQTAQDTPKEAYTSRVPDRLPELKRGGKASGSHPSVPALALHSLGLTSSSLDGPFSARVSAENARYEHAMDLMASAREAALQVGRTQRSDSALGDVEDSRKRFEKEIQEVRRLMEEIKTGKLDALKEDGQGTGAAATARTAKRRVASDEDRAPRGDMRKNLVRLLIQGKLKGEELAPFLVEPENRPEETPKKKKVGKDFELLNKTLLATPRSARVEEQREKRAQHDKHIEEVRAHHMRLKQAEKQRREAAISAAETSPRKIYPSIYLRLQRQKWEDALIEQFDGLLREWMVGVVAGSRLQVWVKAMLAAREQRRIADERERAARTIYRAMDVHYSRMAVKRRIAARKALMKHLPRLLRLYRLSKEIAAARTLRKALQEHVFIARRSRARERVYSALRVIQRWWRRMSEGVHAVTATTRSLLVAAEERILAQQKAERLKQQRAQEAARGGRGGRGGARGRGRGRGGGGSKPVSDSFNSDTPPVPDEINDAVIRADWKQRRRAYLAMMKDARSWFRAMPRAADVETLARAAIKRWEEELFNRRLQEMLGDTGAEQAPPQTAASQG